jgi:hypothetical protein
MPYLAKFSGAKPRCSLRIVSPKARIRVTALIFFFSYGPTGKAIISSTLYDCVNKATSWIQIHNTIVTLTDTPQQWDRPGRDGTLLSVAQFIDYILVPFLTTTLISEDLRLNFDDALSVLLKSSDYGDLRNTDILIRRPPPATNSKPLVSGSHLLRIFWTSHNTRSHQCPS